MITVSFIINILQTNGISYITANIINSLQNKNNANAILFFKYFMAISLTYAAFYYLYKICQNKLLTKLRQWIRFQLVRMLLLVNNENFSGINFTKLSSPINRLSSVCFMVFNDIIAYLLPNIIFLIIIAGYFLWKDVFFGIGFILGNVILILYLLYQWNTMKNANDEYETHVSENEAYLIEILANMDKIVYRGQTTNEIDVFSQKTDKSIAKSYSFYESTNFNCSVMNVMVFVIMFCSIGYLIQLYLKKKIDLTVFITFFTIMLLYRDKMFNAIQQVPDFIEFMGRSESVLNHFKGMEQDYNNLDTKDYPVLVLPFDRIDFTNLSFTYEGTDSPVFKDMNLTLDTTGNKIIGITGISGRGKSTFMKMLIKMYPCQEGAIYIDGENIQNIDADYIRANITYVNQNSKLFDRKIIENIMYGCSDFDACKTYYDQIIQYPKIRELYKNLDMNESKAGSLGEKLSGGQRQVVNLIGGLVNPSKILILDEPTNALDPELKSEILELIGIFRNYKQCIIIITHDQAVIPLFDENIVL